MDGETKKCPECGEEIKAAAKVCRFCGAELEGAAQEAGQAGEGQAGAGKPEEAASETPVARPDETPANAAAATPGVTPGAAAPPGGPPGTPPGQGTAAATGPGQGPGQGQPHLWDAPVKKKHHGLAIFIPIAIVGVLAIFAAFFFVRSDEGLKQADAHDVTAQAAEDKTKSNRTDKINELDSEFNRLTTQVTDIVNRSVKAINAGQTVSQADFETGNALIAGMTLNVDQMNKVMAESKADLAVITAERAAYTVDIRSSATPADPQWFLQYVEVSDKLNRTNAAWQETNYAYDATRVQNDVLTLQLAQQGLAVLQKASGASSSTLTEALNERDALLGALTPQVAANSSEQTRLHNELDRLNKDITRLQNEQQDIVRANWHNALITGKKEVLL